MENLTLLQAIILLGVSVIATLIAVGVIAFFVGFEKPFNPGEFYQDQNDPNLFYSRHLKCLSCHIKFNQKDGDLIMVYFSLPHCLTTTDTSSLIRYIPKLFACVLVEEYPESGYVLALRKSQGVYWRDIQHKILEFLFCKLYKEYGYKLKDSTLEIA
ncbi:MAG: hypothetical protein KBD52_01560 [Candidatus Pacebacteria bacterium]|nr:hypothetical protein [Candidatus Paceibacterota bacterium]